MSDTIGHECGLALVRLRKPLSHYQSRYGDASWGLRRLFLLMEKQRNRGQDGAGVAVCKFDMPPGEAFLERHRSDRSDALDRVFEDILRDVPPPGDAAWQDFDPVAMKIRCGFLGEVCLGHLRYATHADSSLANCHPRIRRHNTASKCIAVAGNFNMTNSRELFNQLIDVGLSPVGDSDTQVVLERLGFSLDREHEQLARTMGPGSFQGLTDRPLAEAISRELDVVRVLRHAAESWDGGYVFAGMLGNGDVFVCRDPAGIRPGFFLVNDEVVAVASERAALCNVFDVPPEAIAPIEPAHVLVVKRDGTIRREPFADAAEPRSCTFERIYFSRGNDADIYRERKRLGRNLAPRLLEAVGGDLDRTVVSYIPNTAETAFFGLLEALEEHRRGAMVDRLWDRMQAGRLTRDELEALASGHVRAEKVAHKDQKLRTFISSDHNRRELVTHIYDITRHSVGPEDTLIVLDDSIVRGTTLRDSIITILSRLDPERIIVASSAPPIMYPDCYGIDMSQLGRFIAFEAMMALLEERGEHDLVESVVERCRTQASLPPRRMVNHVRELYERVTLDDIGRKVSELVRPRCLAWNGAVDVMYQSLAGLRDAMPEHTGDWYFTGDYPTPGGFAVLNRSFLNWAERRDDRAY